MAKQKKLIDEYNFKIVLQQLAEKEFLDTPIEDFTFDTFSHDKQMFEYQQESLKNTIRVLSAYFKDYKQDKESFYKNAYNKYPHVNLDFAKPHEVLKDYYPLTGGRVEFYHFINRMSFWMTMGSGKTIVIIKLVELLDEAMRQGLIPQKNILFFTANEDLLARFKQEIEQYNTHQTRKIDFIGLKDYETSKKRGNLFGGVPLYCYRADLMGMERKENVMDFRDYLDGGDNYVILDEAHKGNKEDSLRQNIFSILSQNGFLFNFSATFTDERDIATTVYNLNQAVWVKKGYGKKLFLLDNDLKAFKNKDDLNEADKQKAVVKSLLLLALAKKHKMANVYHDPMMVVFTNSVNTESSDAEMLFKEIRRLAEHGSNDVFTEAKQELREEFKATKYLITDHDGEGVLELADQISAISFEEMMTSIFYATKGNIEAISNSKNKSEIAFKLDTADKPFALIKIGDIGPWLKDKLGGIKIDETYKDSSYFTSLDDGVINILIGSRSFYEGWDTTRPNIMLFLNIGTDADAKKFVTQSIGRGMRVESVDGSRQRLSYIDIANKGDLASSSKTMETLFVIATNKDSIESIATWSQEQSSGFDWAEVELQKNDIGNKILYIPEYNKRKVKAKNIQSKGSFRLSKHNLSALQNYISSMPILLFSLKHNIFDKGDAELFYEMVNEGKGLFVDDGIHYKSIDLLIDRLKARLYIDRSGVHGFRPLEDEIIHFKKIKVREDKKEAFLDASKRSFELNPLSDDEIDEKIKSGEISWKDAQKYQQKEIVIDDAKFQKILQHYYNPTISHKDSDWLKNIISEESEVEFLAEISSLLEEFDREYDWWFFSKLNQYHDKIFIPYTQDGQEKLFYPDFIFWFQKGKDQRIIFADPKGTKNSDYIFKIEGYQGLFEKDGTPIVFNAAGQDVKVELWLYDIKGNSVPATLERFWTQKGQVKEAFII